jgi:hypothetical protein
MHTLEMILCGVDSLEKHACMHSFFVMVFGVWGMNEWGID